MRNKNLLESFSHAFEGLSHVLWTQKHVRIQFLLMMLVLLLSYVMKLEAVRVMFVLSAIAAVLMAELFNTAIEVVVNMITESYHPLAKVAKDVAAAGVLVASIYALLVGGTIFLDVEQIRFLLGAQAKLLPIQHPPDPAIVVLLGIGVVSILVALTKIRMGHGTILRGGAVSGHTAVAFLLFASIMVYSDFNLLISIMAFFLAFLVAQSRVEGKIHTLAEVLWGATVAILLMALLTVASSR
jgi:diacylglycerol kinase (ATP)